MYRRSIGIMTVLMMAVVLCGVGLKGCEKKAEAAVEPAKPAPQAPEGYVVVEEDVLVVLNDAPGEYFHKAKQSFLKKDYKATAEEIRKGAAFLKLQAARATTGGKALLTASADELDKLANNVEQGTVTSAKTLDDAFARAHYALAKHHYLKAMEYKAKGAATKFGHALKASAIHLERGFAWSGHEMEAATAATVKDAGLVSGKLIEGGGRVGKEAGEAVDKIGVEIEKLGKKLEPAKKAGPPASTPAAAPAAEPGKTK